MNQLDVYRVIVRRRWVVLAVFLMTIAAAAGFAAVKSKVYESTATIALFPKPIDGGNVISSEDLAGLITTYAKAVQSQSTLSEARALNHGPLPGTVKTSTQAGSGILQIIGAAATAHDALRNAQAVTRAFVAQQASNPVVRVQLVGPPSLSRTPAQPRPPLIIALGALLGLLLGGFMALLFDRIWRHVETAEDLAALTEAPVIGHIPRTPAPQNNSESSGGQLAQVLQESFRVLRANLLALTTDGRKVILVTSATSVQGKSTIVASLGIALARAGTSTVIVDADLRRPQQHQIFNVENQFGLSSLLGAHLDANSTSTIREAAVDCGQDRLRLLPAGPMNPAGPELLPVYMATVLAGIHGPNDIVLVDAPPLLAVSDARVLATQCDSVLLVSTAGKETPRAVATAIDRLSLLQCDLMGIVLNRVRPGSGDDVEYGYYE
jgi:capsular exopolysaccharide synthesis family protein